MRAHLCRQLPAGFTNVKASRHTTTYVVLDTRDILYYGNIVVNLYHDLDTEMTLSSSSIIIYVTEIIVSSLLSSGLNSSYFCQYFDTFFKHENINLHKECLRFYIFVKTTSQSLSFNVVYRELTFANVVLSAELNKLMLPRKGKLHNSTLFNVCLEKLCACMLALFAVCVYAIAHHRN